MPDSLVLPAGSRILVGVVESQAFAHRIRPLYQPLSVPDGIEAVSVRKSLKGGDLQQLVEKAIQNASPDMALLFQARRQVEKKYNPYQVFLGWHTVSVIEGYENGQPVARKKELPRFETEYRNRCTRIGYRILQYGPKAEPMGSIEPEAAFPRRCPEQSDADVVVDGFEAAAKWLEKQLRAAGQPPTSNGVPSRPTRMP